MTFSWTSREIHRHNAYYYNYYYWDNYWWERTYRLENFGIGGYVKVTIPLRYVSPFAVIQVRSGKIHKYTVGGGLMINLGSL